MCFIGWDSAPSGWNARHINLTLRRKLKATNGWSNGLGDWLSCQDGDARHGVAVESDVRSATLERARGRGGVTVEEFEALVVAVLGEDRRPNARQAACVGSPLHPPTLIVAGPGTGKTSVLVMRALRHVF